MLQKIFDYDLVVVRKITNVFTLNKLAYVGVSILELNRTLNELHYDCIKNRYGNKAKLLFNDTNSFTYETETRYVYETFSL